MRCHSCDYELWHCTGRTCPECGEEFSLTDFEYPFEKILFHCPHCDYGISGEKPSGIPLASIEECVSCGLAVGEELFIVRPKVGLNREELTSRLPIYMEEGNWFTRYVATVWLILIHPQNAMSRVPIHEPIMHAWKFFVTTVLVTTVVGTLPIGFFFWVAGLTRSGFLDSSGFLLLVAGQVAIFGLFLTLFVFLWALLTHVLLQITGGSSFTLHRTMQAILYSGGAFIPGVIPCVGSPCSFIWWLVASVNMVSKGQRVRGGRAFFATLFGPLFILFFVCGGYAMLISVSVSQMNANATISLQNQQLQIQQDAQVELLVDDFNDQQSE